MTTKPLTPDLMSSCHTMTTQLPSQWLPAFTYITAAAFQHPEFGAFPGLFLSAYNGSELALRRVLESCFIVHDAASRYGKGEQITLSNALIYLVNKLCEALERGELPYQIEEKQEADALTKREAASPKHAPVKKADRKRKPAIDPEIKFTKPGTVSVEKK